MNTKTLFIVAATVATMITGCESLNKGTSTSGRHAAASPAGREYRKSQTAVAVGATATTVATASNRQSSQPTQNTERERSVSERASLAGRSNVRTEQTSGAVSQSQVPQQAPAKTDQISAGNKEKEAKANSVNIAKIADDREFVEALKKVGKIEGWNVLKRALEVKDQKLLLEYIGLYPNQANELAGVSDIDFHITDPGLAEALIDNVQNPQVQDSGLWIKFAYDHFLPCAMLLDDKARAKHLDRVKENREKAAKEGVLIFDRFYIGMPVIDYVMLSREDNQSWTKIENPYAETAKNWLCNRADMKTNIKGKDWKTAWKIGDLSFDPKSRYKYFKIKGTADGLLEFARKYCDKSATRKDITINNNWWQFTDEEHEIKVFLNDESGFLNITSL